MNINIQEALNIGIKEDNPVFLNNKIRATNLFSFGFILVAVAYILFSLVYYPPLTYLPVLALLLIVSGMILAAFLELQVLYRLIIALVPSLIVLFYHRGLIGDGAAAISSTILLQGAFSLVPFLIFDLRERKYLFITGAICFLSIVLFRYTDGWLDYQLNDEMFRTGFMNEGTLAVAMFFIYGSVYTFSSINLKTERESEDLLDESRLQNKMLQEQRAETEKNIAKLEEAQEEERKRAWASEGISTFNTLMRQSGNLDEMYDQLIAGIVKYIGANQAGLYLVEGDGTDARLKLKACYAYNRKKFLEQVLQPGEGLVGQTYLEKDYVYMTDVPQGYVRIKSGLGDATPSALLVVPLMNNGKVEGILEVASFHLFEKYIIEFLMHLGEDIAASISINQINATTRLLLEESQEQAESMRAQEEELRQNMEELSATQEEMKRKELELSGQVSAINSLLATIEFDLEGNVLFANQVFLNTMGYPLEEIRGRHHRLFVEEKLKASAEYAEFWSKLKQGEILVGEYRRLAKGGRVVWLNATYTPVRNVQGELVKILKIASDITEQKIHAAAVESHLKAMHRSNAIVEFDMQGQILEANELFLELTKYAHKDVIGKHHSMFLREEEAGSSGYDDFWQKLRAGEFMAGEFCRRKADGAEFWIYGSYNPILNEEGVPVKVVKYAMEISDMNSFRQMVSVER